MRLLVFTCSSAIQVGRAAHPVLSSRCNFATYHDDMRSGFESHKLNIQYWLSLPNSVAHVDWYWNQPDCQSLLGTLLTIPL